MIDFLTAIRGVDRSWQNPAATWMAWLAIPALGFVLLCSGAGLAEETATDANIVTGLDISYSISPEEMQFEIAGLARAIRSPEVLRAIQAGRYRRIGFAVFAWHHNQFPVVVAWTIIASEADASTVSRMIADRLRVDVETEARKKEVYFIGRLTDLSQAIDHATELLRAAPFAGSRSVVNIIGNGADNVGEDAGFARDRFVAAGGTVNGVVLGGDASAIEYYRQQVIGGPGSFVMSTGEAATLAQVLTRKFLHDIIAGQ